MSIIGVSGRLGSGKDSFAECFINSTNAPWQVKKFAGMLKQTASLLTGVPIEKWEDQDFKKQIMPLEWQTLVCTPTNENTRYTENTWRWFLQVLGTECMRDTLHQNIWVNALFAEIDKEINYKPEVSCIEWSAPVLAGCPESDHIETEFKCYCGKVFKTTVWRVRTGVTKSCGCYQKLKVGELNRTHGDSQERLMSIYKNMKTRCYNANTEVYQKYGAKGVAICEEWLGSYTVFKKWALDNGYKENLSIDRIDNSKNYEPSNCRWIPISDQSRNKETYVNNKLGVRGVSFNKTKNKYIAQIQDRGEKLHIGQYDTLDEASDAYENRRKELFTVTGNVSKNFIITDVRYENEANAIKQRGGIMVRIERPNSNSPVSNHPSETSLDSYSFDEVIVNDGTLVDLQFKVETFINKYNLWQTAK